MAEVTEYLNKNEEGESKLLDFIKEFSKLSVGDAKKMREKLGSLELLKIKDEDITKIIDILPENSEELNKILTGVSLDEDETKKILDTIKEFI
ncbi:MAG: hypothetical protein OQK82_05200 [Candidatus Pacearchaeota archaeon]|nr:hypothetical protein [Candidatus Pacearchaeota archaeon]